MKFTVYETNSILSPFSISILQFYYKVFLFWITNYETYFVSHAIVMKYTWKTKLQKFLFNLRMYLDYFLSFQVSSSLFNNGWIKNKKTTKFFCCAKGIAYVNSTQDKTLYSLENAIKKLLRSLFFVYSAWQRKYWAFKHVFAKMDCWRITYW